MPDWSVIVPVYRERSVQSLVDHIRKIAGTRDVEIIIAGSDGGWTVGRILRPGANVVAIEAPRGRGGQIAEGIVHARALRILVLHADTQLPEGAFALMDRVLEKRKAGAFRFRMDSRSPLLAISALNSNIRSSLTRIPFGDQAHFFLKEVLATIGGYPAIPLFEDVDFMGRLRRKKIPIGFVNRPVVTSARRYRANGYWRTTLKNWNLERDWEKGVSAEKLAARYGGGNAPEDESALLIIFHRALRSGFVKTRMAKKIGGEATLALYRAFLRDIERTALASSCTVLPFVDSRAGGAEFFWPGAIEQTGADLGARMANAIQAGIGLGFKKILLIGSDLPQLEKRDIDRALQLLGEHDMVFGPATDGGYYFVGVNAPRFSSAVFSLDSWSHDRVLTESLALCKSANLSVGFCRPMTDFDEVEDVENWYRLRRSRRTAPETWNIWKEIRKSLFACGFALKQGYSIFQIFNF